MADVTDEVQVVTKRAGLVVYANIVGSIISVIVFLGIVGWGTQMILRDSSGVPVVRALDGPMRTTPGEPGGVLASHQGLTVNEVSSSQIKLPFQEILQLAPRPIDLQAEDQPTSILMVASGLLEADPSFIVASQEPFVPDVKLPKLDNNNAVNTVTRSNSELTIPKLLSSEEASLPGSNTVMAVVELGTSHSLRPRRRSFISIKSQVSKYVAHSPQVISLGTPMAQLGAFSSKKIAMHAWINLSKKHGDYLVGKQHIILKAVVGGGTIYRLRVQGFADQGEARRLCSALNSQNAECYSVVMN